MPAECESNTSSRVSLQLSPMQAPVAAPVAARSPTPPAVGQDDVSYFLPGDPNGRDGRAVSSTMASAMAIARKTGPPPAPKQRVVYEREHEDEPFMWMGVNYILKMRSDMKYAPLPTFADPLLLSWFHHFHEADESHEESFSMCAAAARDPTDDPTDPRPTARPPPPRHPPSTPHAPS
jgi:hypothetical protein